MNWKNVADNYGDGLHIPVAHPGLTRLFAGSYWLEAKPWVDKMEGTITARPSPRWTERAYQKLLPLFDHLPQDRRHIWSYYRMWPNLAFDVYPCRSGACDIAAIDSAVRQIHAARLTNWEFIIQDFGTSPWRWPTPNEILTQYAHWKNQGAIGYWVFAWDYQGQQLTSQAKANQAALKQINS